MQMCKPHWDAIRARIEMLGISNLVAKDNVEINARLEDQGERGTFTAENYDPLMSCNNMMHNALQMGGLYLLTADENGEPYCPICEAVKNGQEEREWIEGPTDAAFKLCSELGMIKAQ